MQKAEYWLKTRHMGTHLRVLNESFLMNTNMIGFRWFSKIFASLCFGKKKPQHWKGLSKSAKTQIYHGNIWKKSLRTTYRRQISWHNQKCFFPYNIHCMLYSWSNKLFKKKHDTRYKRHPFGARLTTFTYHSIYVIIVSQFPAFHQSQASESVGYL